MMEIIQSKLFTLQKLGFDDPNRSRQALDMLLINRRSEFREIAESVLRDVQTPIVLSMWAEFLLTVCLEVKDAFDLWTGKKTPSMNSELKTLTILRQFGRGNTMIRITQLLVLAYTIAEEFAVIYGRMTDDYER